MKAMMLILLLASMAGGNHARAAADEAASSAHAGQHPLNTISQKFQKQFADTDSWDNARPLFRIISRKSRPTLRPRALLIRPKSAHRKICS